MKAADIALTALCALGLSAVHVLGGRLRFLDVIPRSRMLSAAAGISVAYVFLHLLPELRSAHVQVDEALPHTLTYLEEHVYVLALAGLVVFYGLERYLRRQGASGSEDRVFWLHIGSFAAYNGLFGYLLLHREETANVSLLLYVSAIAVHFLVNDQSLRHDHRDAYRRTGRWILAVSVVAGWALGAVTGIARAATALMFSFLAGGIVMNVLKEELPEQRESSFSAFAAGAVVYAALLLLL